MKISTQNGVFRQSRWPDMKWLGLLALGISSAVAAEPPMREAGTLIIFTLTVESSYAETFERAAGEKFDTVQWWVGAHGAWRIKTYAVESDIHHYRIDADRPREEFRKMAIENSRKHSGDVIREMFVLEIPESADDAAISTLLKQEGLNDRFEWVDVGYLLWLPDASTYFAQTKPKQENKAVDATPVSAPRNSGGSSEG